jgi:RND family efflux transporter MFP subunit
MNAPRVITLVLVFALGLGGVLAACGKREDTRTEKAAAKYTCPMHPQIVQDGPGSCPICGMNLVPLEEEEHADSSSAGGVSTVPGLASVKISAETRQAMGLELGVVQKRDLAREIRTSARIVVDETRQHHVTVKVDGWVNELFASVTGQQVKHGDPLLTIYSPDLLSAQQEYLTALAQRDQMGTRAGEDTRRGAHDLVSAARRRLELWDITDAQIDHLERTREVDKYVTLYAHTGGVIVQRNILAGHRVVAGEDLMTIADLSRVWGDADIYQSDLPYVHVGMPLAMSFPYWPGKVFRGRVIFVSPTLDPETRTLQARLEIPNPELLLRPGMYGDATLDYDLGEKLAIPADAVMLSGERAYAFKDGGDGRLIPTEIHVGARAGDWFELLDGLVEGDRIVVSANFLVDSESSLKAALDAMKSNPPPAGERQERRH